MKIVVNPTSLYTWCHFHTRAEGHDRVTMKALDSHPKAILLIWSVVIYIMPTSRRWGLTQILVDHETLFIVYHVGIHVDVSSIMISLDP